MTDLIPAFSLHEVFVVPWTTNFSTTFLIALMGFFVTAACGLVGIYLILRRMALVGDAISHSVLPGLAIAFLITQSRGTISMFLGALAAAMVTTVIIEVIHKKSRVKQDSAIGIAFTSLFALGVIIVSVYASKVDLDQECVLYGEIAFVPLQDAVVLAGLNFGPAPLVRIAVVFALTAAFIVAFYKELLVSSFDPGLASSVGINATVIHYALMGWLSVVIVSAFESVGAILVIAMLILPGATASLLVDRLPRVMFLTVLQAALSSVLGLHLATWLDCSMAAAMVVMASLLFCLAWIFSPTEGLLRRWLVAPVEPAAETAGVIEPR